MICDLNNKSNETIFSLFKYVSIFLLFYSHRVRFACIRFAFHFSLLLWLLAKTNRLLGWTVNRKFRSLTWKACNGKKNVLSNDWEKKWQNIKWMFKFLSKCICFIPPADENSERIDITCNKLPKYYTFVFPGNNTERS